MNIEETEFQYVPAGLDVRDYVLSRTKEIMFDEVVNWANTLDIPTHSDILKSDVFNGVKHIVLLIKEMDCPDSLFIKPLSNNTNTRLKALISSLATHANITLLDLAKAITLKGNNYMRLEKILGGYDDPTFTTDVIEEMRTVMSDHYINQLHIEDWEIYVYLGSLFMSEEEV